MTSIHSLNADHYLPPLQRGLYLVANAVNNLVPQYDVAENLHVRRFVPRVIDEVWGTLPLTSSPSRRLSDLFWINIRYDAVYQALGGAINVLDVGCGSGRYGEELVRLSGNRIAHYKGIDAEARSNWNVLRQRYPFFEFQKGDAHRVAPLIPPGTNFIMSQSCIEHLDQDLTFFRQIAQYIADCGHGVLQVHLFPSRACLPLYLWHGARQYTPHTISHIARLFPDSYLELYGLGGKHCNRLHWKFITWPRLTKRVDLRNNNPQEYAQQLRAAFDADVEAISNAPSFYALVVFSKLEQFEIV